MIALVDLLGFTLSECGAVSNLRDAVPFANRAGPEIVILRRLSRQQPKQSNEIVLVMSLIA